VKARSREYLDAARRRLRSARRLASDDPATCLSTAYYAALYAARAALSEQADYDAAEIAPDDARAALDAAERFIAAVGAMLERSTPT